jgi:hypothetical protein
VTAPANEVGLPDPASIIRANLTTATGLLREAMDLAGTAVVAIVDIDPVDDDGGTEEWDQEAIERALKALALARFTIETAIKDEIEPALALATSAMK